MIHPLLSSTNKCLHLSILVVIQVLISTLPVCGQVAIISTSLSEEFITPQATLNAIVQNQGPEGMAVFTSAIEDMETGEVLLHVKTGETLLRSGVNQVIGNRLVLAESRFSGSVAGEYIRMFRKLPSGEYRYCLRVEMITGEGFRDEDCTRLSVYQNDFLTLTFPPEGDTVFTYFPLLSWTSSFPLDVQAGKRKFRLILTEMKEGQTASEALLSNPPIIHRGDLKTFNLPYPRDAKHLENGVHYAWQVQSYMNENVLDVTDVWWFVLWEEKEPGALKYAELKKVVGGEYYTLTDNKLYIAFDERYGGIESMTKCRIMDAKHMEVHKMLLNDDVLGEWGQDSGVDASVRTVGKNEYLLDVSDLNLVSGMYLLEMENYKGEVYKLNFVVE